MAGAKQTENEERTRMDYLKRVSAVDLTARLLLKHYEKCRRANESLNLFIRHYFE